MAENGEKRIMIKIIECLAATLLLVCTALSSWALIGVSSMKVEVARLNAVVKVSDLKTIITEVTALKVRMARIPDKIPPQEVIDGLIKLEQQLNVKFDKIDTKMDTKFACVETRIDKLMILITQGKHGS